LCLSPVHRKRQDHARTKPTPGLALHRHPPRSSPFAAHTPCRSRQARARKYISEGETCFRSKRSALLHTHAVNREGVGGEL
jgi:hypothetical protein